ncbi:ATP-binding protein [Paratractidigestivibacter sp.]|uniref:AAA family ATPase n=1 Tax=Paratractidigestivibacter sp. TaxID=2847316 RepID=UPI002AC8B0CD|nr:ATP-binding protein [Paratractidigestivibacter sp.]
MLLNLSLSNWMSYRDDAELNLVGSLERQHKETLAKLPGFRSKYVLPVAAIYGGNASGKTNIFKALSALRLMVTADCGVSGTLPVDPFRLDSASVNEPTCFDVMFLAGSSVYRYYLEASADHVCSESLELVSESGDRLIFERDDAGAFTFGEGMFSEVEHVGYAAKSTRGNQLFLQSAVAQNVNELMEPYLWFAQSLELVGVGSQAWSFATAAGSRDGFLAFASSMLSQLDTGISRLVGEPVGEDVLPRDAGLRKRVASLSEGEILTVLLEGAGGDYGFEMLTVRKGVTGPDVERLRTVHAGPDGREHRFSLGMESSGTKRLMGLLPMLFDLSTGNVAGEKVFVVDELDRCLHTMLTKRLVQDILATCGPGTRKQMLFTTYDLLLMDQSIMRRDEMYITERDATGESELIALAEYRDLRYDKDLVRSYLDGRFGGIPMFGGSSR